MRLSQLYITFSISLICLLTACSSGKFIERTYYTKVMAPRYEQDSSVVLFYLKTMETVEKVKRNSKTKQVRWRKTLAHNDIQHSRFVVAAWFRGEQLFADTIINDTVRISLPEVLQAQIQSIQHQAGQPLKKLRRDMLMADYQLLLKISNRHYQEVKVRQQFDVKYFLQPYYQRVLQQGQDRETAQRLSFLKSAKDYRGYVKFMDQFKEGPLTDSILTLCIKEYFEACQRKRSLALTGEYVKFLQRHAPGPFSTMVTPALQQATKFQQRLATQQIVSGLSQCRQGKDANPCLQVIRFLKKFLQNAGALDKDELYDFLNEAEFMLFGKIYRIKNKANDLTVGKLKTALAQLQPNESQSFFIKKYWNFSALKYLQEARLQLTPARRYQKIYSCDERFMTYLMQAIPLAHQLAVTFDKKRGVNNMRVMTWPVQYQNKQFRFLRLTCDKKKQALPTEGSGAWEKKLASTLGPAEIKIQRLK